MYLLKKKLGTKFWIMLLALTILISAFAMPVFAAGQSKEPMPPAKQEETLKSAPISLKEIEEPIPNPQYQYYLNHKEEFTYGYIPPKYIFPQEKTRNIRTRAASPVANIRKYDSRSSDTKENHFGRNVITPRKNQFNTGTCWAQANLAVVESLLKINLNQDYDLSEGHMAYNIDDHTDLQSGGNDEDVLAYCARLAGPVLESNFPAYTIDETNPKDKTYKEFDPSRANLLPVGERDTFKILGDAFNKKLDVFVPKTLELDLTLENLKKCIYENGSVPASYFITYDGYNKFVLGNKPWDGPIVKTMGVRYHYINSSPGSKTMITNHAVELIGWDDDMKITNSKEETATGAFLVKNSIPAPPFNPYDDFRGYHWISYESFLGNGDIVPSFKKIITPRDARLMSQDERKNLKNVYNTGKTSYLREANIKGNLNKAINIYERSNNEPETIKYLTYYNVSDGPASYKIFITEDKDILKGHKTTFANGTQGETLEDIQSDKWVALASGTFTEKGYNTLEVTKPFTLTSDKFALKIEIESKKIGLAYKSWSEGEKVPTISYRYNDENADPFFEKIRDLYCLFLGTVTVKANEYTVTVTKDGNGTATADLTKGPKGTKVTLKAEPNQGYEFDKWEVEGARVADPQASETILTIGEGNASAKAIFKEIAPTEYTVSFETAYGTKPEDQKIKENGKATAPQGYEKDITEILNNASGKTYVFKGWFIGTEEYNFETEVKEDKKLTAKWEEKIIPIAEYTVTVSSDTNGTATADLAKGPKGTKVTLTAVPNQGYEFDKWEVEGAIVADPQAPTTTLTLGEENVSAKAIFKEVLKKILDVEDDKIEDPSTTGYIKFVFDARSFGQIAGKGKVAFEVLKGTSFKDPDLQKKIKEEVEGKLKSGDKEFMGWSPQITKDASNVEEGAIDDKRIYAALYKGNTPPDPSIPKPQDPQPQIPRKDHNDYYEYEYYPFYKRYNEDLFKLLDTNSKIPAYVSEKTIKQLFLKIGDKEYRDNLGNKYQLEVAPIIKNDRTLIPARAVAEILGTKVAWDNKTRTASFSKGGLVAKIQIDGNKIVLSNGRTIEMDSKPLNIEGRILISLTNLANALGIDNGNIKDGINQTIEWDDQNKTVIINLSWHKTISVAHKMSEKSYKPLFKGEMKVS